MKFNIKSMTIDINSIKIQISAFFLPAIAMAAVTGFLPHFIIVFISIFLHESGHIAIALKNGCRLVFIRLLPIGINAELDTKNCTASALIAIYAGGPATNLLLSASVYFLYLASPIRNEFFYFFTISNICLAAFNLIPVFPLDGGRLLQEILKVKSGLFSSVKYIRCLTILLSIAFILIGLYQLLSGNMQISLFFIGIYLLFFSKTEKMEASLMNIRQILLRKSKLIKKGIYPSRGIVVMETIRLSETIRHMDYDRFHLIYILDVNLKLLKTVTENEIMEALIKYSGDMTFQELLKNMDC